MLGLNLKQKVTRPPAVSETRWAGILPQIAWLNEHRDDVDLYKNKPAKACALLDGDTTSENHAVNEYERISICGLDAALRPCCLFFHYGIY